MEAVLFTVCVRAIGELCSVCFLGDLRAIGLLCGLLTFSLPWLCHAELQALIQSRIIAILKPSLSLRFKDWLLVWLIRSWNGGGGHGVLRLSRLLSSSRFVLLRCLGNELIDLEYLHWPEWVYWSFCLLEPRLLLELVEEERPRLPLVV